MAWKGKERGVLDYKRLKPVLARSATVREDDPLNQTVGSLIDGAQESKDQLLLRRRTDVPIPLNDVSGKLAPINGGSYSLYYFPTITDVANVTLSSQFYTQYYQVGKIVYVSGKVEITPTAGATLTIFEISLPVISKFASADQLNGIITGEAASGVPTIMASGSVTGNVSIQTGQVRFFSLDTSIHDVRFMFSYELF